MVPVSMLQVAQQSNVAAGGSNTMLLPLFVSGTLGVAGAASISNGLAVVGAATVVGPTTLASNLAVQGPTALSNALGVTGPTVLASNLAVLGPTALSNTLYVSQAATLGCNLTVQGTTLMLKQLSVTSSVTANSLQANGALTVTGVAGLSNALVLAGTATLGSSLAVAGNATFGSNVGVGAGASPPLYPLHVSAGSQDCNMVACIQHGSNAATGRGAVLQFAIRDYQGASVPTASVATLRENVAANCSTHLAFSTLDSGGAFAERVRIAASGNVAVCANGGAAANTCRLQVSDYDNSLDPTRYGLVQTCQSQTGLASGCNATNLPALACVRFGNTAFGLGYGKGTNAFGLGPCGSDFAPSLLGLNGAYGGTVALGASFPGAKHQIGYGFPTSNVPPTAVGAHATQLDYGGLSFYFSASGAGDGTTAYNDACWIYDGSQASLANFGNASYGAPLFAGFGGAGGAFVGSNATPTGAGPLYGPWHQLQCSAPFALSSYTVSPQSATYAPKEWYVLGSQDGANWTQVDFRSLSSWSGSPSLQFATPTTAPASVCAYSYFRFVITKGFSPVAVSICEFSWAAYSAPSMVGIGTPSPAYQLDLSTDGARKLSTTTWLTGSDARVKLDVRDADLDVCYRNVRALPLRRFRWDERYYPDVGDRNTVGWIAQEVEAVFPNAVTRSADFGFDDFRSLNSDVLLKTMYGALQRTMADVERLQAFLSPGAAGTLRAPAPAGEQNLDQNPSASFCNHFLEPSEVQRP